MRKINGKIISVLVAVMLLLSVLPISALADAPAVVGSEQELLTAVSNGGTITLKQDINITYPLTVDKDVVLNLGKYSIRLGIGDNVDAPTAIRVSGAVLTVNCDGSNGHGVQYGGAGSTFVLIGTDTATKLIINDGYHTANTAWLGFSQPVSPAALIISRCNAGMIKPEIVLNGGQYFSSAYDSVTQQPLNNGAVFSGEGSFIIKAGTFANNPQANLDSDSIYFKEQYGENYIALAESAQTSAEFKEILNDNNNLTVNIYKPAQNESLDYFMELLSYKYGQYDLNGNIKEGNFLKFYTETYDYNDGSVYVSLMNEDQKALETHKIKFDFNYNQAIKDDVDKIIESMPADINIGGYTEPYSYTVTDLEFIGYLLACKYDDGTDDDISYHNESRLINFSSEYKKYIGYKNFGMDPRMGYADRFYNSCAGIATFEYGGTVYAAKNVGAIANHVIYVPDGTANTKDALLTAAQQRIDGYFGKDKVTLEYAGTLSEVILRDHYNSTVDEWSQWNPNATFEEWLAGPCCPVIDYNESVNGVVANANENTPCFKTKINGITAYLLIESNTAKMAEPPTYQNIDILTEVSIESDNASVPLDTLVQVQKITSGDEYDKILKAIGTEDGEIFDIKLHSAIGDKYITKLDNGKFQVKIPVPEKLEGKNLVVYYVDADNKVTEHEVTVKDGFASFTTDHFSIYTLAEKATTTNEETKQEETKNTETKTEPLPKAGDSSCLPLLLALAFVSACLLFSTKAVLKKSRKN